MNINDKLDFLQIQEVTTKRQKANGTREFKLPVNDPYGDAIHVASYSTGYVRRTKTTGRSDWQLNKRCESEPDYYKIEINGETLYRKFTTRTCVLIPIEIDRLEYLISYCLKNYYIKGANQVADGNYVPKWRYESYQNEYKNRSSEINDLQNKLATIQRIADHG